MAEHTPDLPVGLVQRMFALIDCQSWADLDQVFHEAVTYDRPGYPRFTGRAEVAHFYRETRIIGSGRHQLEGIVGNAERAACWGKFVGVSRDGRPIEIDFADSYHFRGDKVIARKSYFYVPGV